MSAILSRAKEFLWSNGRLLERRLFAFLFEDADGDSVLAALRAYQNEDGGFGNALEPDKRCSDSQPVDQEVALRTLDMIGMNPPIAHQICDFLVTITTNEGGVPFVLPTVRSALRAPWWNTDDNPSASINPTAAIAGLLHKHKMAHPWLEGATAYCWNEITAMGAEEPHNLLCAMTFLQHVPERERAEREFARLSGLLLVSGLIALDAQAEGYIFRPLDWAPTPDSLCRRLFSEEVIQAHLGALLGKQQEDGGWPIAWPAVSPACEWEYRGVVTLKALKTLRAYGRIV